MLTHSVKIQKIFSNLIRRIQPVWVRDYDIDLLGQDKFFLGISINSNTMNEAGKVHGIENSLTIETNRLDLNKGNVENTDRVIEMSVEMIANLLISLFKNLKY